MVADLLLTGSASKNGFPLGKILKSGLKTALFMEALRNLNWSRDYLWYCELDGVPSPFQRGGVLGLPVTSLGFTYTSGQSFSWDAGCAKLAVPQGGVDYENVNLTVMDDEQGTLRTFFERWFNHVYNPYTGVLPVTEACKCLTIYFQKQSRRNIRRVYYDIDSAIKRLALSLVDSVAGGLKRETEGIDLYVYPEQSMRLDLNNSASGSPFTFTVTLRVAHFANADFGNPTKNDGVKDLAGRIIGDTTEGNSWLDKIADYI